ncbi:MAG: hypothetical protein KKI15_15810 [Proteobacteria bacterium]|nr:hypothetical protein [Pseudomonadota bacterium]
MKKNSILTISLAIGFSLASPCLWAADFLSDEPMETKVQTAPPNVMFVLDNSGSMDWEFIAEDDGLFHNDYYLYNPGDNAYTGEVLDGGRKLEWLSQWSEYNKIFYNPHSSYEPWPRWETLAGTEGTPLHKADLVTPRSNPIHSGVTQNIHNVYYANLPLSPGVVVDNADGAPSYVEYDAGGGTAAHWQESTLTPEWAESARYTSTDGEYAVFTPNIPTLGNYAIYTFINCYNGRDQSALIEVDADGNGTADVSQDWNQQATVSGTPESGVCGEWVQMFSGQSFQFNAGLQGTVTIRRDTPNGASTLADAVAFVPAGDDLELDIRVAHYYTVNDINDDGVAQNGEAYLVNFVWTDDPGDSASTTNNDLDNDGDEGVVGQVDANELERRYYLITASDIDNDTYDEVEYATHVTASEIPDSIIPKFTNEDGSTTPKTNLEDLQNFANWFSFYRRRELTAKAAISRTVADLDGIYVGYYTINSGLRQPVLPIKVEESVTVTSDNKDSTYSDNGKWYESGSPHEWEKSSYYTSTSGKAARFQPNLPTAGNYQVQAWWNCYNDRDQKAKITIHHNGGDTVTYYNQRANGSNVTTDSDCTSSSGTGCCGYWIDLGNFDFTDGTSGYVEIARHSGSTGSSTVADAVKFIGGGSTTVDRSDDLLNYLYGVNSGSNTPLRTALQNVGRYFDQDDNQDGNLGNSPFYPENKGGACQQTYAIVMSDGYWNGTSPGIGNQNGAAGAPYQDGWDNTLADVAWRYYNDDLADGLPNELATNNYDTLTSQHMVTFAISFGLDGVLNKLDLNNDGTPDNPSCYDDPYFLDPTTPTPTWPKPCDSCEGENIDDMWHAAVSGHGEFFSAKDPDALVTALTDLFSNISSRAASGASVSVNGDELTSNISLFQSSYSSGTWEGDVTSYPINPSTGEVLKEESDVKWHAKDKLQSQNWDTGRRIITFDGSKGQPFRYTNLSDSQQITLLRDTNAVDYIRGNEITGFRSRYKMLGDIIHSAPLLVPAENAGGDNIDNNSDGTIDETGETGGVIFAGGNDGMLHAFNANTGSEMMAYLPNHIYYRLHDLTKNDFTHRFFVDATPSYKRMNFLAADQSADGVDNDGDGCFDGNKNVFNPGTYCNEGLNGDDEDYSDNVDNNGDGHVDEAWETKKFTMLVGGLNKGGKGVYALNISNIEKAATQTETQLTTTTTTESDMVMWEYPPVPTYTYGADQSSDSIDNDDDGTIDEADENYSDSIDNDGDGTVDETGELVYTGSDDDMGFSYSAPFIVKSYKSRNEQFSLTDSPWVVIFGNGYESVNESAVLYVVDAFTGNLVRKIDTGATGSNGLSETAVVDINNDDRVDYVYAGDLKGNLWKFDLTDPNPDNWGVVFGADNYNPTGYIRIDAADDDGLGHIDVPQPLFTATGQPITTAPDVTHHPSYGKDGYLIVFGTGKFLGEDDRNDHSQQTIYGLWDYALTTAGNSDGLDNNKDGSIDEAGEKRLDPSAYLGTLLPDNTLSNLTTAQLLEQTEIDFRYYAPASSYLRTLSDNTINWYLACSDGIDNDSDSFIDSYDDETDGKGVPERCVPVSPTAYASDNLDNNLDGSIDETGEDIGHAGWYFNLPFGLHRGSDGVDNDKDGTIDEADEAALAGERVIKNVIIRDGKAIIISFIPDDSPCSGGGNSILHEIDAVDGSRLSSPSFDINGDGIIDDNDMLDLDGDGVGDVAPSGRMFSGMLHTPVIVGDPDNPRELKIFSSSAGTTEIVWETKEKDGVYYWRER